MSSPPHFRFEDHVFPAELETIRERRRRLGGDAPPDTSNAPRPTTAHRLFGLALSGGGIRSATFNLGVLQGLHRLGLLRHVDYLSTVSGGGYIGGALSAMMHRPNAPFPFVRLDPTHEAPGLRHVRDRTNYLIPGGMGTGCGWGWSSCAGSSSTC